MSWWLDLEELDDEQREVIALPKDGNYLIKGPPGSGKTNLLLIRAEYLIRTGKPNLLVLMFNDSLHDFVVRGGAHYNVPSSKIRKLISWQMVLLREHGVSYADLPEELVERRKQLTKRVLDLIGQNPGLEKHLQCLLVDEVQDCLAEEIELFFRVAESVCFAGDDRQRLYSAENVLSTLKGKVKEIVLTHHYRVGHKICEAADVVGKTAGMEPIEGSCNYNPQKSGPSKVEFIECADDAQQAKGIIAALSAQLKAYPDELLCVAAPRNQDRDFLRTELEASTVAPHLLPHRETGTGDPDQRIYVANLYEVKGLEFRTIHLGLMQHVGKLRENQKRITYTAMTRGKTTLSIYYTGSIPGYLEQAEAVTQAPKPAPDLKDLFPKKKGKK